MGASYYTNSIVQRDSGCAHYGFDDSFSNTDRPAFTRLMDASRGFCRQSSAPPDMDTRYDTQLSSANSNESSNNMGLHPLRHSMPDASMDDSFDSPKSKHVKFADESSREEENDNRPTAPKQDAAEPIKNSLFADDYSLKDENDSPSPKYCDTEALTKMFD